MNADAQVMGFFPETLNRQASDDLAARIRAGLHANSFGLWAVEVSGFTDFAGFIGLSVPRFAAPFTPAIEIGWRLVRGCWGKGYATEGALEVLRYAFEELQLAEIVSFTSETNIRSMQVMKRTGMHHKASDDFDHPGIPEGHPLRPHVLYRINREDWIRSTL